MSDELKVEHSPVQSQSGATPEMFFGIDLEKPRSPQSALFANLFGINGRFTRESFWVVYGGCVAAALLSPLLASIIFWPFLIALTWVSAAAVVKRFHDRDKSGFWWLVSLIPFVGTVWILVECGFLAGEAKPNEYGLKALTPADLLK